jgi:hypothetical protein
MAVAVRTPHRAAGGFRRDNRRPGDPVAFISADRKYLRRVERCTGGSGHRPGDTT